MTATFKVATVNLLNDLSRWNERRTLLVDGLIATAPDLIALQEVTDPLGASSTAEWLTRELGGYTVHVAPKTGWERKREGIAVLSRLPVERHEVLKLPGQRRTAQLVEFWVGERKVVLVNGHYFWPPGAHASRTRQVERVLERLRSLEPGTPIVVCGDFNGAPGSAAIALIQQTFRSSHEIHHGTEPDFTCPTSLQSGNRVRGAFTRGLLRLFTNRPGESWKETLDYIFVSPELRVVGCGVFLDKPSADDPTLYASDHLGLAAVLEVFM